ncbi:hypothetical protein M446_1217 [Methylobacterium sp. 4-46]|uniref:hypothetical protein n=1 Tax=unclassified Methylobacterium TaxID=2615210 RepID=UPI000152C64E|nr:MULTISPECIES: hypothetical protein [Methylobacterium]ACA15742.1 hypothetical protein M446_1217 [Methylobacterium sp. 4-46]WFT81475.1 hypothetical protein QA634_06190 [Methylobacterium nodulans]
MRILTLDERRAQLRALLPKLADAEIDALIGAGALQNGAALRIPLMFADSARPPGPLTKDGAMTLTDSLAQVPDEFRQKYMYVSGMLASDNAAVMEDAAWQADALVARMRTLDQIGRGSGVTTDSGEKTALAHLAEHLSGEAVAARHTAAQRRAGAAR